MNNEAPKAWLQLLGSRALYTGEEIMWLRLTVIVGLSVLLSACSAKPFTYHANTESPAGPGLFTGNAGELHSGKAKKDEQ